VADIIRLGHQQNMAQKWYQKASVQTACVSGIFFLVGIAIPYIFKVPKLHEQISRLEKENVEKTAEIQRIETQLVPFKTYALEHYPGTEKEALSQLENKIKGIGYSVDAIKEYTEISKMDFSGSPYNLAPPLQYSSALTKMLEGCYDKKENAYYPLCGDDVEETYKKVIENFPKFPFSYYGLASCLKNKGDASWKSYAEKAVDIFKKTTSIDGHNDQHDQALKILQNWLNMAE